jgi:hypothetical protein
MTALAILVAIAIVAPVLGVLLALAVYVRVILWAVLRVDALILTDAERETGDVDPWLQAMAKRALDPRHDLDITPEAQRNHV